MNYMRPTCIRACTIHLQTPLMFPLNLCTVTIDVPEIRTSLDESAYLTTDTI